MELTNLLSEKECDRKYCEMKLQDSQATIASMKESIRASAARNKQMLIEIEEAIACDRGIPVCREVRCYLVVCFSIVLFSRYYWV